MIPHTYKVGDMKAELLKLATRLESVVAWDIPEDASEVICDVQLILKDLAATLPDAQPEPVAWISRDRVRGKDLYGKLPIQSIQPGVYSHTPLYAHPPAQPEPVAWQVIQKNGLSVGPTVRDKSELESMPECVYDPEIDTLRPLYAHPPAQPEPSVPVSALEAWLKLLQGNQFWTTTFLTEYLQDLIQQAKKP